MVNRNSKSKAQKKKAPAPATHWVVPQPTNVDIILQWTRLPEWANTFIPSLTQALYTSHEPFSDFKQDSDGFLTIIQHVFDESFPHIQYSFESSDALVGEVSDIYLRKFKTHVDINPKSRPANVSTCVDPKLLLMFLSKSNIFSISKNLLTNLKTSRTTQSGL